MSSMHSPSDQIEGKTGRNEAVFVRKLTIDNLEGETGQIEAVHAEKCSECSYSGRESEHEVISERIRHPEIRRLTPSENVESETDDLLLNHIRLKSCLRYLLGNVNKTTGFYINYYKITC